MLRDKGLSIVLTYSIIRKCDIVERNTYEYDDLLATDRIGVCNKRSAYASAPFKGETQHLRVFKFSLSSNSITHPFLVSVLQCISCPPCEAKDDRQQHKPMNHAREDERQPHSEVVDLLNTQ